MGWARKVVKAPRSPNYDDIGAPGTAQGGGLRSEALGEFKVQDELLVGPQRPLEQREGNCSRL